MPTTPSTPTPPGITITESPLPQTVQNQFTQDPLN